MLLAQLTVTHIVGAANKVDYDVDNNGQLAAAVDRLNNETIQPDAVLVMDDITENGTADEVTLTSVELGRCGHPCSHSHSHSHSHSQATAISETHYGLGSICPGQLATDTCVGSSIFPWEV